MTATAENKSREEKQSSLLGCLVILLAILAVFLLVPGMAVIALVVDFFKLQASSLQMWAFGFVISACLFGIIWLLAGEFGTAGKIYCGVCAVVVTVLILFLFGFKSAFAARWVAHFIPPPSPSSSPAASGAKSQTQQNYDIPSPTASTEQDGGSGAVPTNPTAFSNAPLPLSPPAGLASEEATYSVTGLAHNDSLNVRAGPGTNYPVIERLSNGFGQIHIVGRVIMNDRTAWVHISFGGTSGWVTRDYLRREER